MKIENSYVTLSSGRRIGANCGYIGITPSTGYWDNMVSGGFYTSEDTSEWTLEERKELFEYVIGLWREWALSTK